jgi:hypothetical protein
VHLASRAFGGEEIVDLSGLEVFAYNRGQYLYLGGVTAGLTILDRFSLLEESALEVFFETKRRYQFRSGRREESRRL